MGCHATVGSSNRWTWCAVFQLAAASIRYAAGGISGGLTTKVCGVLAAAAVTTLRTSAAEKVYCCPSRACNQIFARAWIDEEQLTQDCTVQSRLCW